MRFISLISAWLQLCAPTCAPTRTLTRALATGIACACLCMGSMAAAQTSLPANTLPALQLGPAVTRLAIDTQSEYWVDQTGEARIEELEARASDGGLLAPLHAPLFTPRTAAQMHTIHGRALWIRFNAHMTDPQARWFLELGLSGVQTVDLYWRNKAGQWMQLRAGNLIPHAQWPVPGRSPVFPLSQEQVATTVPGLSTASTASTVYYLRITNERAPFSAPLSIYRDTELVAQREMEYTFIGAYAGLTLLIATVSLALGLAMQDRSFYSYVLYLMTLGAFQMNFLGVGGQYLYPHATSWVNLASYVLPPLAAAAALWFVRSVIRPRQFAQWLDSAAAGLTTALLGLALYAGLVPTHTTFQIVNTLCIASVLFVYVVIGSAWLRGNSAVRWIAVGFLPVVLGALPPMLRNTGLISTSFITQYGITLGAFIEMPVLLYALMLRSSNRRVGLARAAGLPNTDALTGLFNTRRLLQKMDGATTRALRFKKPYGLLLVELTNHNWFVKEHGAEMGNRALVLLGMHLQRIARDVDTAARLEGNQFILLAEGPCDPSYAAKLATKIASIAHARSNLLPVGATLKLRITCALMPDPAALEHGEDASAQLAWLIEHAERTALDPRKLVRTLNF